jgi:hypothetical protein
VNHLAQKNFRQSGDSDVAGFISQKNSMVKMAGRCLLPAVPLAGGKLLRAQGGAGGRVVTNFNRSWKFQIGDYSGAQTKTYKDTLWSSGFYLLGSENFFTSVSNWTRRLTNQFDAGGNFNFTNLVNPDWPQGFFLLQIP